MFPSQRVSLSVLAVSLSLAALPAHAALWDWSYSGAGIDAAGTFITTDTTDSDGDYQIDGITGARDGVAIVGLEPTGEAIPGNSGYPVDNLITPGGLLTLNGFGYELADGTYANPYYATYLAPPAFYEVYTQPASNGFSELPVTFTATLVPEPGSAGILLAALAGLAAAGRRRVLRGDDDASPHLRMADAGEP